MTVPSLCGRSEVPQGFCSPAAVTKGDEQHAASLVTTVIAHAQRRPAAGIWLVLLRTPRALFSVPLPAPRALLGGPPSAGPDTERRMLAASVLVTERRRLALLLEERCCRAARRAAASAGDSRADRGPRGMLLLRVGERCCVLGRAVRLPLGAPRCAAGGGEGEGTGMRLPAPCSRFG